MQQSMEIGNLNPACAACLYWKQMLQNGLWQQDSPTSSHPYEHSYSSSLIDDETRVCREMHSKDWAVTPLPATKDLHAANCRKSHGVSSDILYLFGGLIFFEISLCSPKWRETHDSLVWPSFCTGQFHDNLTCQQARFIRKGGASSERIPLEDQTVCGL